MKEESNKPPIDPELEARIVALVLGEASDFERDQLNQLIAERSELAEFKETIQGTHVLLQDLAAGEPVADDDDWKLAADKRNEVLSAICGETEPHRKQHVQNASDENPVLAEQRPFWTIRKIAAILCTAGLLAVIAMPATFRIARTTARTHFRSVDAVKPLVGIAHSTAPTDRYRTEETTATMTADEDNVQAAEVAAVEFESAQQTKSALSGIRDSLDSLAALPSPYYLEDDVQYGAIVPDTNRPRSSVTTRGTHVAAPETRDSKDVARSRKRAPQSLDMPAAEVDGDWSFGRASGGERWKEADLEPGDEGKAPLSFSLDDYGRDGTIALGHSDSERSSIRVPDAGTVMLGGVKRSVAGPGPGELAGETLTLPPAMPNDYDTNGVVDGQAAAGGAIVTEGESLHFNFATPSYGYGDHGNGKDAGQPQGGSRFSIELSDSPTVDGGAILGTVADERFKRADGESTRDYSGGMGGGGFAGGMSTGGVKQDAPSAQQPDNFANGKFRGENWEKDQRQTTPAPSGDASKSETAQSESLFGLDASESSVADLPEAPSHHRETAEKYFSRRGSRDGVSQFAEERNAKPGVNGIAPNDGRSTNGESLLGQQGIAPIPSTGTGELSAGSPGGKADEFDRWGYELRAKESLDKLSLLSKLQGGAEEHANWFSPDGKSLTRGWAMPRSGQEVVEGRTPALGELVVDEDVEVWEGFVPPTIKGKNESLRTGTIGKTNASADLDEKSAEEESFSTFSLHVSDVAFKLAQAALAQGEWPDPAKIRIEEFVNAFDYGDPMPSGDEKVSCRLEQSVHPFLQQRNLLRVSMRTAAAGRASSTPLRLTLLLDNSGSMERIDRRQTVRRAFALLTQQLKPIDQVTLICFARQPRLLADKVHGGKSHELLRLIEDLPSQGGTNIEAALKLAFEKAREQQAAGAQNRIVLLTDGAVNLGDADPERLSQMIASMRDAGIAFDAAGISAEGLNDEILEALTRKGDGRYYLLDTHEAADDGFARQLAGALRPSAKNVKVQIEFNPQRVGRYKLLGFEKHRLKNEDFRDDTVDAAEMAAAEAGVAVYQFEPKPDGDGDVGSVSVRFRDVSTGQMVEHCWPIPYEATAPRLDQAAPSQRVATVAALFAAKLRGGPLGETVDLKTLSRLIAGLPQQVRKAQRVEQLQQMIGQARQLSGE